MRFTHALGFRRASSRGVTLIEVMIVVVILGMIASAVALAVFPQDAKAKIRMAHVSGAAMRHAADVWRSEHGTARCPTPAPLVAGKLLDRGSRLGDPWGTPY